MKMELQPLIIGLIGIVFLLVYLTQRDKLKLYRKRGIKTQGIVIDLVASGRNRMYYPMVRFTLPDGYHEVHQSSFGSNPALFKAGEIVELLYLSEEPSKFVIIGKHSEKSHVLFLVIGLLAFGYFMFNLAKELLIS